MNEPLSDCTPRDSLRCDFLDDYLNGNLSADHRTEFESHLHRCASCRETVDEWKTLCHTLQTAIHQLESPDHDLLQRIDSGAAVGKRPYREIQQWRVAGLVMASLLAAVLFAVMLRPAPRRDEIAQIPIGRNLTNLPSLRPKRAFSEPKLEFSEDVIGVPIDIGEPDVKVVWLYPTAPARNQNN